MAISIRNIAEQLEAIYQLDSQISEDRDIVCSQLFNKNTDNFDSKYLYIGFTSDLTLLNTDKISPANFILIINSPFTNEYKNQISHNLIFIKNEDDVVQVFNKVQEIFINYGFVASSASKLVQCIAAVNSFQEIVDIASDIFENPILLLDSSLYVIAYSKDALKPTNAIWNSFIKKGYAPEAAFFDLNTNQTTPHRWFGQESGPRIMHIKIKSTRNNLTIGYAVILEHNRPFIMRDIDLTQTLSNVFSIGLQIKRYSHFIPESVLDAFIKNLLSGEHYDADEIEWRIRRFGWHIQDGYIVRVALDNVYDFKNLASNYKKLIQDFYPSSYTLIHKGHIVAIVDYKKNPFFSDGPKHKEFAALLSKHKLSAGISNIFHHPSQIYEYYEQTYQALHLGVYMEDPGPIFLYSDYVVQHLFNATAEHIPLQSLCDPTLREIIEYDRAKDTSYAYTLYMYLKNCQDIKRTSCVIHVHYNTLKYRLDRLTELFGLSLTDGNRLFNLWFSFQILSHFKEWSCESEPSKLSQIAYTK